MANLVNNFSFETDTSGWTQTGSLSDTLTVENTLTAVHGTKYAVKTAAGTGARNLDYTDGVPVTAGQTYSFGAYVRWVAGATPRDIRLDVRWLNSGGTAFQTETGSTGNGSRVTATTGSWQLLNLLNLTAPQNGVNGATDTATTAIIRLVILSAAVSDAYALDGVIANSGATLGPFEEAVVWNTTKFVRIG